MATGLCIDTSDIDLLVSGNFSIIKQQLISQMEEFDFNLHGLEGLQEKEFIATASVPVIKLVFNLSDLQLSEQQARFRQKNPLSSVMQTLKVDVSFQQGDLVHQGQE